MLIKAQPELSEKLALMGNAARHEPAGDAPDEQLDKAMHCIAYVATPQGRKPILKALLTSHCERSCHYCPFRAGRPMRRVSFTPDELAAAFDAMHRAGLVQGIFISSGILNGGVAIQDKILATADIIRHKHKYAGYMHIKIMPGAEYDQVRRAMQLGDRVSVNLEAPSAKHLQKLAPQKNFHSELTKRLAWTYEIRAREGLRAGTVTQFVVGAADETDLELLELSARLYRQLGLRRVYFSAFEPIPNTPLEGRSPTPPIRERRLYQAGFLLRDYGWDVEELPFAPDGNLRTDVDPKLAWALENLAEAPVDVMKASRRELLHVPGIGPKGADAIIKARKLGPLRSLEDLRAIGIRNVRRAAPFILFGGRRPDRQLTLFPAG